MRSETLRWEDCQDGYLTFRETVATMASLIPAAGAAFLQPMQVLREE